MRFPLDLIKTAEGLWEGKEQSDKIMLDHLSQGCVAVRDSEINRLRYLATLHDCKLLLPGEKFE